MTEISCEQIEQLLVDYSEEKLSPSQSTEVGEHLATCQRCRRTLKALQRSLDLVQVVWEDGWADCSDHTHLKAGKD